MTTHDEPTKNATLTEQKRWLKARRKVDPTAAFLTAVLTTTNKDLADLVKSEESLLVARQQLQDTLEQFDKACHEFRTQLQQARHAEHWIRASHRKTTPVAFREIAQMFRREPEGLARKLLEGLSANLTHLIRGTPGAVCPACTKLQP